MTLSADMKLGFGGEAARIGLAVYGVVEPRKRRRRRRRVGRCATRYIGACRLSEVIYVSVSSLYTLSVVADLVQPLPSVEVSVSCS